jgi:hypothetical protein
MSGEEPVACWDVILHMKSGRAHKFLGLSPEAAEELWISFIRSRTPKTHLSRLWDWILFWFRSPKEAPNCHMWRIAWGEGNARVFLWHWGEVESLDKTRHPKLKPDPSLGSE